MEGSLKTIKHLAASGDSGREQFIVALRGLADSLETTNETIHRYGHMNLQTAAVKASMNLGLFGRLTESNGPLKVDEISQKTGASIELLNRLLRFLAASGAVKEVGAGKYAANHITKNLAEKLAEAGVSHYFGTVAPMYQTLPSFLDKTRYEDPSDELHTVFQDAWNTELPLYAWMGSHPDHLAHFNDYMALRRQSDVSWLSVYPVREETKGWDRKRAVFVNVGGSIGHQCAQFKQMYPEVPGRVILQDLPHSIAKALSTSGVENTVHNFFEPQPIKGAKFYHLRGVLHNHPPQKVQQILGNIKSAMTSQSILLIDEMILPEIGVKFDVASIDIAMLTAFAGMERSEAQWRKTFIDAGLELFKTYTYNPDNYENVMDVRLAETTT